MNRERAETYLRVLAEAELRRATSQPWSNAQRAGYARLNRVAQVLAFAGALDERAADQILDDFEHNCQDSSILHMHASGPACHTAYGPDELYSWPPIWICDSSGRWHATRTSGQSGMNSEIALRLEIVPPAKPRHDLDRGAGNRAIS